MQQRYRERGKQESKSLRLARGALRGAAGAAAAHGRDVPREHIDGLLGQIRLGLRDLLAALDVQGVPGHNGGGDP
eukprot:1796831-Pyramimonas_sp.AAC.1